MKTRHCLLYVAAYLLASGVALLVAPEPTLKAMLTSADYGNVMPRWVGMLSVALGTVVVQVLRHRLAVLYPLGFFMPAAMLLGFAAMYLRTADPLFLTVLAVVGIGVLASGISLLLERRAERRTRAAPAGLQVRKP